jgi:hypothetical protein
MKNTIFLFHTTTAHRAPKEFSFELDCQSSSYRPRVSFPAAAELSCASIPLAPSSASGIDASLHVTDAV